MASLSCLSAADPDRSNQVIIVKPIAVAHYLDKGQKARDDEVLYGMSGAIVGEEDANGFRPVLTQYRYRVLLHRDDYMLRTAVPDLWQGDPSHLIAGSRADVLAKPDVKAFPPLMTLPRGAFVRVSDKDMDSDADYREILLHDGRTGYIRSHHLRPVRVWSASGEDANRRQVVQDALSYLGVQYRWGGKSPEGIDCSGLASMAYLLNGLAIFRNSRPSAGFPVALLHMPMLPGGGYDRQSLSRAKPGDLIYWLGHQAIYLGEGRYLHANFGAGMVSVNSLYPDDPDCRSEHVEEGAVLTWGTVYPEQPTALLVKHFAALPSETGGRFHFVARLEGYAPTRATLYPEGVGEGKPAIAITDPEAIVMGAPVSDNPSLPEYHYKKPGVYHPVVVFENDDGWLPEGKPVSSGMVVMEPPVVVR